MIRPKGGTTRHGSDEQDGDLATPTESVGDQLRRAREERGLDLLSVHDRLSRPITQIEALETGNVAALPDEALATSTLRRYATLLGLDGEALAEQFAAERGGGVSGDPTRAVPAVTSVSAAVTSGPDHLKAFTETGEVPQVGGRGTSAAGTSGNYGYALAVGPPTGTFPVVPRADLRKSRRSVAKARRRMKAPTALKAVTWVVAVLVLVVAAGWVLLQVRPRVLANAHILRVVAPGSVAATGGGSPAQATPTTAPASRQTTAVQSTGSTPTGASYSVATDKFDVVVATSGPCWVQVTSSTSAVPLISGVQQAAKVLTFPAQGTMTVEVGSSAVLVGITIKGKHAFTDAPKVAPFTYTFAPAA